MYATRVLIVPFLLLMTSALADAWAFADTSTATIGAAGAERRTPDPQIICVTLAPSPTAIPECIDLTQWAGHRH